MVDFMVSHILYPDTKLTLALFCDVENTKEVKKDIITAKFDAAFLKTSMIPDPFIVVVAANKAIHSQQHGKMTTKTVHSEILYNLSPSRKITESFKKFGLSDLDTSVLVAVVESAQSSGEGLKKVKETLKGRQVNLNELSSLADMLAIKKEYKLFEAELSSCSILDAITSRIASKDIVIVH